MLNRTNRFQKWIMVLGSIVFVMYFSFTLLYSLQKNNLYGGFWGAKAKFQLLFYQKWGFFKDREAYNSRLYYIIKNKSSQHTVATIEVLKDLRQLKSGNAPFNQKEIITDNILKRCMAEVTVVQLAILDGKTGKNAADKATEVTAASQITQAASQCSKPLQTLQNYASIVASAHGIDTAGNLFKIVISQKYFNEFANRNIPAPGKEEIVFEGSYNSFK
jgi:hypothetical protein